MKPALIEFKVKEFTWCTQVMIKKRNKEVTGAYKKRTNISCACHGLGPKA